MHNVSVQQNQLFVVVVVAFFLLFLGGGGGGGEQSGRIRAEQMLITAWMDFLPQPVPRAKHLCLSLLNLIVFIYSQLFTTNFFPFLVSFPTTVHCIVFASACIMFLHKQKKQVQAKKD